VSAAENAPGGILAPEVTALLDGLADPVLAAGADGIISYANPAAGALLGTTAGALVGTAVVDLIPERLQAQHLAGYRRYVESGVSGVVSRRPLRVPARCADGSEREIELSVSAYRGPSDEPVMLATIRDLADRVELERQRAIGAYLNTSREIMAELAGGSETSSLEELAPVLLDLLGRRLGWDAGALWTPGHDDRLRATATWSAGSDELTLAMSTSTFESGEGLAGRVFGSGQAEWIETITSTASFSRRAAAERVGIHSCFAFPVVVQGTTEGVIEMYSRSTRVPEPQLLAILQTAGLEIGRYLERSRSRSHLVEMAEALQASLLPPQSPVIPGLDIAVRYRAASGEGQIGGDFFDVFPLPDGQWVILIGDVSGRGPKAAALTALARYTLRAAAVSSHLPSAALNVLNDVVRRELEGAYEGDERFLTVAYMIVNPTPDGYAVSIACGGHPRPLTRRTDGSVEDVPCEGELIGPFEAHQSVDRELTLTGDELIVLVTDGILEAGTPRDEFGEDRLREVIAASGTGTAAKVAAAIESAVVDHVGGHVDDDLAIVVLRVPSASAGSDGGVSVQVGETIG